MNKYTVYVSREWTQYGEVVVESSNESDAKELAYELLLDNSDEVRWGNAIGNCENELLNMERGDVFVQDVVINSLDSN